MIVVDANIAVGWCIAGHPLTTAAIALRRANPVIIAPDLLIAEVTNALARLAIATPEAASEIESGLEQLPRWFTELAPSVRLRTSALRWQWNCSSLPMIVSTLRWRLNGTVNSRRRINDLSGE